MLQVSALNASQEKRIITLSPHLTEIVFELGLGNHVIAVSDYSDYPDYAKSLPRIASYQGANIAEIIRLEPTHILGWKGGNKDADILKLLNFTEATSTELYVSQIEGVESFLTEVISIGEFLDTTKQADLLVAHLEQQIDVISQQAFPQTDIYYYMGISPLYGLGNDAWLNSLLHICNINNKNKSAAAAYSALDKKAILRAAPDVLIAADNLTVEQHNAFWQTHREFLDAPIVKVNPDAMHRFTPRAIYETIELCKTVRMIAK